MRCVLRSVDKYNNPEGEGSGKEKMNGYSPMLMSRRKFRYVIHARSMQRSIRLDLATTLLIVLDVLMPPRHRSTYRVAVGI